MQLKDRSETFQHFYNAPEKWKQFVIPLKLNVMWYVLPWTVEYEIYHDIW